MLNDLWALKVLGKFSKLIKTSSSSREGFTKVRNLTVLAAVGILTGLLSSCATPARSQAQSTPEAQTSADSKLREDWRASMAERPLPKQGCFEVGYPNKEWKEVGCTAPPPYPMPPKRGPRPLVVGNADDISAQSPTAGFITSTTGSFTVSGVTSESGPIGNSGPAVANAYTLQINTDFFTSTACTGSPNPGCQGWEQFVHWNPGGPGSIFIQYWLIKYNATCPAGGGWNQFSFTGSTDIYCWRNAPLATAVPNQVISNLGNLVMTGTATAAGDSNTLATGGTMYSVTGSNSVNAGAGWRIAEFNVFGAGGNSAGGGMASFNAGSSIVPRTRITYGGTLPPICRAQGFTGETNNLSFGPTAPAASGPGPAILFTESSAGGATSNCAAATAVGDTHLATFSGLFYDFQASGDFILAQVDPDFVVQTRQVSGAPTWPNASVNSAVATQMGKNKVAICLGSPRLSVDGANTDLADGKTTSTSDGVDVTRRGNVYFITDEGGDSVRATVNSSYIDVSVGLGHWPAQVKGLLANVNGNVNQLAARDGTVLTNEFSFEDLYQRFGESWRLSPRESLLSACGDGKVESGNPQRTFYARDLPPELYNHARAVCTTAGVKEGALLDACTLDVAVIGDDKAAQVFVSLPQPVAVGNIVGGPGGNKWSGLLKWWWLWLLLLILLILLIRWILKRKHP